MKTNEARLHLLYAGLDREEVHAHTKIDTSARIRPEDPERRNTDALRSSTLRKEFVV